MKARQARMLQSLRAAKAFLDRHAVLLPEVAASGARRKLDALLLELDAVAGAQTGEEFARQIATRKRRALRAALLHDHMAPMVKIAHAELLGTCEMAPFKMPPRWASPEILAPHAHGMAEASAPYAGHFISAGLRADFAERLGGAADALTAAVGEQRHHRGSRRSATTGLASMLGAGRRLVAALGAMVASELSGEPALLVAWDSASRTERAPRVANAAAAPALPAPEEVKLLPAPRRALTAGALIRMIIGRRAPQSLPVLQIAPQSAVEETEAPADASNRSELP